MVSKELATILVAIAKKQLDDSIKFKQPRLDDIKKNEDLYLNKSRPALKGRFNVPLPIMSGYIDVLLSKQDEPVDLKFKPTEEADKNKVKKIQALYRLDSSSTRGKWDRKDRWGKKLAAISGRAIYKIYSEKNPEYANHLEVVDYNDFHCEPYGGADLDQHLFLGQTNIFKNVETLVAGSQKGFYYNVPELVSAISAKEYKENEDKYRNKVNRFNALGLSPETSSYVGQDIVNLIEWCLTYKDKRYYLLFDYASGLAVRCEELTALFPTGKYPWVSWATDEDPFNFWSKAPADAIRPVAESMSTLFNQALENRQKRNFGQRAFDPTMFKNPSLLEFRADGLVPVDTKNGARQISSGIYEFQTAEVSGTIDLFSYLDNFLGKTTGITPETKGASSSADEKVGVYYGKLQQVADRLGLYNKAYRECWEAIGSRYVEGLIDNLKEETAVKLIGEDGIEWDQKISGDDLKNLGEVDTIVESGAESAQADDVLNKSKQDVLVNIQKLNLTQRLNPQWLVSEMLKNGGYSEEDVAVATDVNNYGDEESISEAAEENQLLYAGKAVKPNSGATTGHIQKHIDFAKDNETETDVHDRIMAHANAEIEYAVLNMTRKARSVIAGQMAGGPAGAAPNGSAFVGGGTSSGTPNIPMPSAQGSASTNSTYQADVSSAPNSQVGPGAINPSSI